MTVTFFLWIFRPGDHVQKVVFFHCRHFWTWSRGTEMHKTKVMSKFGYSRNLVERSKKTKTRNWGNWQTVLITFSQKIHITLHRDHVQKWPQRKNITFWAWSSCLNVHRKKVTEFFLSKSMLVVFPFPPIFHWDLWPHRFWWNHDSNFSSKDIQTWRPRPKSCVFSLCTFLNVVAINKNAYKESYVGGFPISPNFP